MASSNDFAGVLLLMLLVMLLLMVQSDVARRPTLFKSMVNIGSRLVCFYCKPIDVFRDICRQLHGKVC